MNKRLIPAYVLSAFNVILIAVSVGLSLYTVIVVPIFFIALFFTIRGSVRGWFVWVGCICFLIYFSAEGITDHIPLMRLFFIYNPLVSLYIFVSSIIALTIVLWSFDIKSMTSLLTDIVPPNLTASLFFVLVLNTFWGVFVDLSRFEFTERIDVLVLFIALVHTFFITMKVLLLLTAGFSLLLRRHIGYFLSYLIFLTFSLNWLGCVFSSNPLSLFPGLKEAIEAHVQGQVPKYNVILLSLYYIIHVSYFIIALSLLAGIEEKREELNE
jgi:hypothetical protein